MAETVKVIVRCRPMNKREKDLKCKVCVNKIKNFRSPKFGKSNDLGVTNSTTSQINQVSLAKSQTLDFLTANGEKQRDPVKKCSFRFYVTSPQFPFQNCVFMDSKIMQCSIINVKDPNAPPKNFTFDGAYGPDSTTENIYNEIAYPLVEVQNA